MYGRSEERTRAENIAGGGRNGVELPCEVKGRITLSGGGGEGTVFSDGGSGSW